MSCSRCLCPLEYPFVFPPVLGQATHTGVCWLPQRAVPQDANNSNGSVGSALDHTRIPASSRLCNFPVHSVGVPMPGLMHAWGPHAWRMLL